MEKTHEIENEAENKAKQIRVKDDTEKKSDTRLKLNGGKVANDIEQRLKAWLKKGKPNQ